MTGVQTCALPIYYSQVELRILAHVSGEPRLRDAFANGEDVHAATEADPRTPFPVISLLSEQQQVHELGGTMRLGAWTCKLEPGSLAAKAYGTNEISERHRHRYEFNPEYRREFVEAGMTISGTSPDGMLAEIVELATHPWFLAVQYHPEFKSKPHIPHPLFRDFVGACVQRRTGRSGSVSVSGDSVRAQG